MEHIKTYYDMLSRILRSESEWDLMYYLETITTGDEALKIIRTLKDKLIDMAQRELDREMNRRTYTDRDDLIHRFMFIVEKQRGYPLWMWEYWDIEESARYWADDNWYTPLFEDYD